MEPTLWKSEIKTETPAYCGYPDHAVLTIEQVAAWLQVGVRQVERWDIPHFYLGSRTKRYTGKSVREFCEKRIAA